MPLIRPGAANFRMSKLASEIYIVTQICHPAYGIHTPDTVTD